MDKEQYAKILEAAIDSEIEANLFYRQAAEKVKDSFLKEMFSDLAAEELKHRRILEAFRDRSDMALNFARVEDFHVAETVTDQPLSLEMTPTEAIALAMKKEEVAMKHYTQLAEACADAEQRKVFLELAEMERGHKAKMESAFVDIGYPEVW